MSALYDGPIIDCHHHLWDLSLDRHPWLRAGDAKMQSLGDLSFLRKDYMPADYLADAGAQKIVGTVYVEAKWDPARPPEEEMAWVAGLEAPQGIGARRVASAPLETPGAEAVLDRLAAMPGVAGVRETIRWHPDPAKAWAPEGRLNDLALRRGIALLAARGLLLEVLMNPYQCQDVALLARDMPGLRIVVNHCASPMDRDEESRARWRAGLAAMASCPNVAIKLSNFTSYALDGSAAAAKDIALTVIDAFGPGRCLFGTDYPVGRRAATFQEICERLKESVAGFSAGEQRAIFHDNAAGMYGFG